MHLESSTVHHAGTRQQKSIASLRGVPCTSTFAKIYQLCCSNDVNSSRNFIGKITYILDPPRPLIFVIPRTPMIARPLPQIRPYTDNDEINKCHIKGEEKSIVKISSHGAENNTRQPMSSMPRLSNSSIRVCVWKTRICQTCTMMKLNSTRISMNVKID